MNRRLKTVMAAGLFLLLLGACAGERPKNLGEKDGTLATCPPSPNCISSQAGDEQHYIAPLSFGDEPDTAFARLVKVLKQRPDIKFIKTTASYLMVELRTTFFVDDAEFLLDRDRHIIQVRSASRLGYSDLGKNRRRMEEIRAQFDKAEARR